MEMGFWARLALAFKILFDAVFASRVQALQAPAASASPASAAAVPTVDHTTALQLLAILQREGRFVDFLQEDVAGVSDADIGAAARVVHDGCRRGLKEYLAFEPVRKEAEGAPVTLDAGFDAARTRLTGNVVGQPPFKGRLAHHGWQVSRIALPSLTAGHDPKVVAPAEVEL